MGNVVTNAGTLGAFIVALSSNDQIALPLHTRCTVFWVIDAEAEIKVLGHNDFVYTDDGYVQIRNKNQSWISNAIRVVELSFFFLFPTCSRLKLWKSCQGMS